MLNSDVSYACRLLDSVCLTMSHMTRNLPAWCLALVALSSVGCDGGDDPEPIALSARVHVGKVDGTDVVMGAVVESNDTLTIYSCGGATTLATHTRWFGGTFGLDGDPNAFSMTTDDFVMTGERTEDGISGELVEPDGTAHAVSFAPTADDAAPGLYSATMDGCRTGVVVFDDGTTQGTYCNDQGEFTQVIILQPGDLSANGFEVSVERPDGPISFFVDPV